MWSNKVEYSTAVGAYCTSYDDKAPFCMQEFSSKKIIKHCFHVNNKKGESGIGYDMIISYDLMIQLGLTTDFNSHFLQWDGATVHRKEKIKFLGKFDLTKREMREVVMQTVEQAFAREATE